MNSPWNNRRPSARPPRATPLPPSGARGDGSGPVRGNDELRLYGVNAVLAMHARRPQALRKLYLAEALIPRLQPLLKWCVGNRVGYRVVGEGDLNKLAATTHHEGVVADVLRAEPQPLAAWLAALDDGPVLALWLDGVGNPHNFGAILRSAAHFGTAGILLPAESTLSLSGADQLSLGASYGSPAQGGPRQHPSAAASARQPLDLWRCHGPLHWRPVLPTSTPNSIRTRSSAARSAASGAACARQY